MDTFFKTIPKLALIFCVRNPVRFFVIVIKFWYVLVWSELFKRNPNVKTRLTYRGQDFVFGLHSKADIAVMKEVFLLEEYRWKLGYEPQVILDLGAHIGDTALYYHACYPKAKIVAVEPSPESYKRLVEHTNGISNIFCVQAAVGEIDGSVSLHMQPSTLGNSVMNRVTTIQEIKVRQITLDTLCREQAIQKIDLLKFDIEGAEIKLLQTIDLDHFARSYIGELHFDMDTSLTLEEVYGLFTNAKLRIEKIKPQRYMLFASYPSNKA